MSAAGVIGADAPAAPRIHLEPRTIVMIGNVDDRSMREVRFVRRRARYGTTPSRLEFVDDYDQITFLTDEQIGFLQRANEFRVVLNADGSVPAQPRNLLELDEVQRAVCDRRKAYVDVLIALTAEERKSRKAAEREIARVAAARKEDPPGVQTVYDWFARWDNSDKSEGTACLARRVRRTSDAPPNPIEEAVRLGVGMAVGNAKKTAAEARTFAGHALMEAGRDDLAGKLPDVRTFQRRIKAVNKWIHMCGQYGPEFATRELSGKYETKRPDLPLEAVEVDHTPLDMLIVDDSKTIVYGRPDVIAFRDRCTGSFLGMSIGFEAPSYASFVEGLKHAIYPKDMTAFPEVVNPWYAWGRFRRLYVDNALHFLGLNIQRAASELCFQISELPPATPTMKGAEERLLGILNMKVHSKPGSTFSNYLERRNRAELSQKPVLTLREITAFLYKWVCDEYHVERHEGLGFLRTLSGIPQVLWRQGIERSSPIAPLPPEELFLSLAGDVHYRSINDKGIRLDHIRYGGPALNAIREDKRHAEGMEDEFFRGTKLKGSQYRVSRNPFDLSYIEVRNPYLPDTPSVRVPAFRQDYTKNLTVHQHLVNVANANADLLDQEKEYGAELMRAKLKVARGISILLEIRKQQNVERRLARYHYQGRERALRSLVTTRPLDAEESGGSLLATAASRAKAAKVAAEETSNVVDLQAPGRSKRSRSGKAPNDVVAATGIGDTMPVMTGSSPPAARRDPAPFDPEAFADELDTDPEWKLP